MPATQTTGMRVSRIPISAAALFILSTAPAGGRMPGGVQTFVDQFGAVSANVGEPGRPVEIRVLEWSTDDQRQSLLAAFSPPPPEPTPEPEVVEGRGGPGRGGRGGRGRGSEPVDPVMAALAEAPTVGYVWTDRIAGYAIKYAHRAPLAGGGERIILVTNRRLGVHTTAWDPVETDYEFTIIEMRLDATGRGEGKSSLTDEVAVDREAGMPALEDYDGARVVLADVRRPN
jgi:hypothetical protein